MTQAAHKHSIQMSVRVTSPGDKLTKRANHMQLLRAAERRRNRSPETVLCPAGQHIPEAHRNTTAESLVVPCGYRASGETHLHQAIRAGDLGRKHRTHMPWRLVGQQSVLQHACRMHQANAGAGGCCCCRGRRALLTGADVAPAGRQSSFNMAMRRGIWASLGSTSLHRHSLKPVELGLPFADCCRDLTTARVCCRNAPHEGDAAADKGATAGAQLRREAGSFCRAEAAAARRQHQPQPVAC